MTDSIAETLASNAYLPYILMPFIVAFVGWITNLVGVKMMFHPAEFKGIGPFGWQGIIPRIRVKLTRDITQMTVSSICTPRDMIEAMNESDVVSELSHIMEPIVEDLVDDFMEESGAKYWRMTLLHLRRPVYKKVQKELPKFAEGLLNEIKERADYLLNIEELAVEGSIKNPGALTGMVESIYAREFNFIVKSGLYIGFPLGCLQAILWSLYPMDWLLPIFGAFVGGGTNWIALQVLVHPTEPRKIFGRTFHGMMVSRQQEVAGLFAEQFTTIFMDAEDFIKHLWDGPHKNEVQDLMKKCFRRNMDSSIVTKAFDNALRMASRGEDFDEKLIRVTESNLIRMPHRDKVTSRFMRPIQDLLENRMKEMSHSQFAGMFLPMFDENKWLMIAIGAGLGAGVGFLQLTYLFGESLT